MFVSDVFQARTNRKYVYNITAISNIPSIIQHGVLCYDEAKKLQHTSVAMDTVQERRDQVMIPHGLRLHRYANFYFDYHNPMLYLRQNRAEEICVLAVDSSIMDTKGCVLSDRNAAAKLVKFYPAPEGIHKIDFEKVFAKYWTHDDFYESANHKAVKCAEVLVPHSVPFEYIIGAYVVSKSVAESLRNAGFSKKVVVEPKVFYK